MCKAAELHLCHSVAGWEELAAPLVLTNTTVTLDLGPTCGEEAGLCSALAFLWRQTPCTIPLHCPIYSDSDFKLPATPWIWRLHSN